MSVTIPYNPDFKTVFKSTNACILFQQLLYWMERTKSDDGSFYKFTKSSPKHPLYKQGDSWCEELRLSKDEFDTAKHEVVMHYSSKEEWLKGRLNGNASKPFSSYYDRQNHLVHYFPNPTTINNILQICDTDSNKQGGNHTLGQGDKATFYKVAKPPSTRWQSRFRSIQEITHKMISKMNNNTKLANNSHVSSNNSNKTYKFSQEASKITSEAPTVYNKNKTPLRRNLNG